jgi:adenosylcobinamide-GDP ribazoletransferase
MSALVAAIRLLTVIPIGSGASSQRAVALSPAFFPVVGTVIGLATAGAYAGASEFLPSPVAAAIAVLVAIALTGAIHIDGLADTADGLFGGRTRERRLEIMADPRVGTFGISAIGIALLIRWAAIGSLEPGAEWSVLVVAAAMSRTVVLGVMAGFPYARPEGIGEGYSGNRPVILVAGIATAVGVALLFGGPASLLALLPAALVGLAVAVYARRLIGGVTGDIYGAVIELAELAALLTLVALAGSDFTIGVAW